jgi:hypothetical protein
MNWSYRIEVLPLTVSPNSPGVLNVSGPLSTQYCYGHVFCTVAEGSDSEYAGGATCAGIGLFCWFTRFTPAELGESARQRASICADPRSHRVGSRC